MTIQQRIAAAEGLHQTHQGVVDRLITMGVILTENVTNNTGAFAPPVSMRTA